MKVYEETMVHIKKPQMYAVVIYNDDYTTMDFVIEILVKIFHKTSVEASEIMMHVHTNGKGEAGVYTYDIALTKKLQTEQWANEKGFPLKITIDEAME